jgi:hypothetical protein
MGGLESGSSLKDGVWPAETGPVSTATGQHLTAEITTTGHRSELQRRIRVATVEWDGTTYLSGSTDRSFWPVDLLATPRFTLHLEDEDGIEAVDMTVYARPITDPAERRAILRRFSPALGELEARVTAAPLFAVDVPA